ncbi:MAG: McrC family protein [Armatimonadota bacterium]|jgi:5-methylcytosine-specific restriction enzyme subunit McrC
MGESLARRNLRPEPPLHLQELGEQVAALTPADAQWLTQAHGRRISVTRSPACEDRWLLRVGRVCGALVLPSGRRVYIEPRIPVRNVWTMLGVAGETDCLSWPAGSSETLSGLVDGLMEVFVAEVELLVERGVTVGYRSADRILRSVRGRLDVERQLRELAATPDRFACRFAEFSRETPENLTLSAALQVVRAAAPGGSDLRASAVRCLRAIGCREDLRLQPNDLRAAPISAATRHYRTPLALARLLLHRRGVGHRPSDSFGAPHTPSLMVEMPRLFERFVCRSLARGLPAGTRVRWAGHSVALDDCNRAILTPDAVVEGMAGPLCIVDAKYKPEPVGRHEPSASDLYQMLAYCVGYGVEHAVLVYPRAIDAASLHIRHDGFCASVHPVGIDLSADAQTLRPRGEQLCAQIVELARLAPRDRLRVRPS